MITSIFPKIVNAGTEHEGKAFDNPGYENALKESGYTAEEAQKYWSDISKTDPYAGAAQELSDALNAQAPQVSINGDRIAISAPKAVLESPLVAQIQDQLQTLKGADLSSPEVSNAINALNDEIKTSLNDWMIQETFGWTPEEFKDYQYATQTVNVNNPMSSSNKLKAKRPGGDFYYEDDGTTVMEKTPQEWIDYWRTIYNTDQRTDMFLKSLESDDPYERVMALIMSKGKQNPVYGYDPGERIGQGLSAFWETANLFPKGVARIFGTSWDVKRMEDLSREKDLDLSKINQEMDYISWNADDGAILSPWTKDEASFEKAKDEIKGKTWKELSDAQKLFVLELGVSKENSGVRSIDRDLQIGNQRYTAKALEDLDSPSDYNSRTAIENVLINSSYDKVKQINSDLWKWQAWDEKNVNEPQERLSRNAIWSNTEQNIGRFAGTLGRFMWENAVGKALTGFSMNKLSDVIGEGTLSGINSMFNKFGWSPLSPGAQNVIKTIGSLIGTVPEDLLQTSVDNIVTYNSEENANLFNPEEMSENFKNNLIFMAAFNAVRAGWSSVKRAKMLKQLAKQAELDEVIDIGDIGLAANDAARTIQNGGSIEVSDGKVYAVDADGTRRVLDGVTEEQGKIIQKAVENGDYDSAKMDDAPGGARQAQLNSPEFDDATRAIKEAASEGSSVVDDAAKAADDGTGTVKVEVDTPNGKVTEEVTDYNFKGLDDAISPDIKIEATPAGVRHWHSRALNAIMGTLRANLTDFHNRFGDVRASDFDWIWYNTKKGLTPDKIIGTIDPTTNRTVTQNMIDAAKWWGEQDFTKKLRTASRAALGKEGDLNVLGYLPHTSYDPSTLSYDEALAGMLWTEATGKSVLKDGNYVGYGGTLEGRYRTFASNMLWDIGNKEVAAAKLIEEAQMDGKTLTPDEAIKIVEGGRDIIVKVGETKSSKDFAKAFAADGGNGMEDFKKAAAQVEKDAPNSGAGKAIHDNYSEMYVGANRSKVSSQPKVIGSVALNTQGDTMRKIVIGNGMDMYSWGGADIVYADQNAFEFVTRVMNNNLDFRNSLTEFIMDHSHRSRQYAESVADRMITKLAKESRGQITKGDAIKSLSKSFKSEAWSRMRKWLVMADYDNFNSSTKKFIDDFLFRHMQMDSLTNNQSIITKLSNNLVGLRYKALFYGNFKNALLQVSELNRLFTVFKFRDVSSMLKRLATDADFRTKVDMYVNAVAPETSFLDAALYEKYGNVSDAMKVDDEGVRFEGIKDAAKTIDDIALAPINAAESLKNRTMVAALVSEADRLGYTGNEALMYIRQRFERVALAQNEMGRIGLASNPIAKPMLFLQNFQMRELGMHYYNIADPPELDGKIPNKTLNAAKYITKVLGTKLATTLILSRLGYSASQTLGLDPFGIVGGYERLSDEEKTWIDQQISGGFLTPFVSGGITSLFADMYFMAREAYEDANRSTISEEAEANLNRGMFGGLALPDNVKSGDFFKSFATNFIPGSTFANRIGQMNEMMDTGWATSATGNKMYTAPDDRLNTILGYLFGRSATENALQYQQNYGDDLGQTLSRTVGKFFAEMTPEGYSGFDPIDTKNYSDWFDGSENDAQQFEKGKRYFQNERNRILAEYEDAMQNKYASSDELAEAKTRMNDRLNTLYEQLERFVDAYENEHGTITGKMVKDIVNILDTERKNPNDTAEEAEQRGLREYDKALERYSQLGLPMVGTYTGPSKSAPEKEVKYQGSPQWRTASGARYDLASEAVDVLKQGDLMLKDVRKALDKPIDDAYDRKDYNEVTRLQKQYLEAFDKVVGPILATYGNGVLTSTDVVNQLKDMLSTGTNSRSGDLIPSEQYRKDKNGRYRSMPLETVDVKKWAQQRYSSDIYKNPTVRSYSTVQDDLDEIKRLSAEGKPDRARARALQLKVRVDNQIRSISQKDYQWLLDFLNNGGK